MSEYSQAYWNELIEKYKDGSISDGDRYQLEKQALDDPFLFDALEGFSLYENVDKDKKEVKSASKIFTLPRIAAAASIVFLVAMIFSLKPISKSPQDSDQSIAMVLEKDKQEEIFEKKEEEEIRPGQNNATPPSASEPIEVASKRPSKSQVLADQGNQVKKAKPELGNNTPSVSGAIDEETNISDDGEEVEVVSDMEKKEEEEIEEPSNPEGNMNVDEIVAANSKREDVEEMANAVNFESNNQIVLRDVDSAVSEIKPLGESVGRKEEKTKTTIFYNAVPVIGKKIFDEYAKERIDERGLRKEKPQEVTIEFTIDKNGMLTNFHHIFTGCSECGPFAISLLQNSGEWKTVPPGHSGKARYTFIF